MAQANRPFVNSSSSRTHLDARPVAVNEAELQEMLRHCPPGIYEAAQQFRITRQREYLPAIVQGVMARYVDPGLRVLLGTPHASGDLRLRDDLGLDSLSLMEIVMRLEDILQISVRDDDLRQFRTLGEVRSLVERTLDS